MDLKSVLTETNSWPVENRLQLMHELWDRLVDRGYEPDLTEEQKAELDRRLAEDEAAPDDVVSWGGLTDSQPTLVRTDRGLSISGTRITLSAVMDYVTAGWPAHLIRDRLQLTDKQICDVLAYIEAHRAEVEQEHQAVLRVAEENRRYWEERNRDRVAGGTSPPKPEQAELRAKLQAWKARLAQP